MIKEYDVIINPNGENQIIDKTEEVSNKDYTQYAKADKGKLQITLVPTQIIRDIAKIRMYGTEKYKMPYNWVVVDKERYKDALLRHILAYLDDENSVDSESGLKHLWHAACNIAFLCEMDRDDWDIQKELLIQKDSKLVEKLKNNK